MDVIDLSGSWSLQGSGIEGSVPALVPGSIHADLLAADLIPDPFDERNEVDLQWIGEESWVYRRSFSVSADVLASEQLVLRCDGLDTLAELRLNGRRLGRTDNMFRIWRFDLTDALRAGENHIEVRFASCRKAARQGEAKLSLLRPRFADHEVAGSTWLRKEQCDFGWDWGPSMCGCGIWRAMAIEAWSGPRLDDVRIEQQHRRDRVDCVCAVSVDGPAAGLRLHAQLRLQGQLVAEASATATKGMLRLRVEDPELWWPNGLGEQPLYDCEIRLLRDDEQIDQDVRRLGLRRLELRRKPDRWGESFEFLANGRPFFAKGANWIPADAILGRATDANRYAELLGAARDAHMNMIRVWGGGLYEEDSFYDHCDEMGLCVWQDFMFTCGSYPAHDEDFMANVIAEARQQIRRLRHHASLALWCGNNEITMYWANGDDWPHMSLPYYKKLFEEVLPALVEEGDAQRDYWSTSPQSGLDVQYPYRDDPCSGDVHLWDVWHGRKPFEWYRGSFHRFCSEFGFQSFPEPRTVDSYARGDDRNITAPIMEHHQRSPIGNARIMEYMLGWYRMPKDFTACLWLSQIQQGLAIAYAVEHWRRNMKRCRGALFWQLNDCWPVASWASIDYFGRWKALQYMAKRFFAPLLHSVVEDEKRQRFDVHLSSDAVAEEAVRLHWFLSDCAGKVLSEGTQTAGAKPGQSRKVLSVDAQEACRKLGQDNLLFWVDMETTQGTARQLAFFTKPKGLSLVDPLLKWSLKKADEGRFTLRLRCRRPALFVFFESSGDMDVRGDDNFVHLHPQHERTIMLTPSRPCTLSELRSQLRLGNIVDTYAIS